MSVQEGCIVRFYGTTPNAVLFCKGIAVRGRNPPIPFAFDNDFLKRGTAVKRVLVYPIDASGDGY